MKKFLYFILFLVLLIFSEYYFLNEIFGKKRLFILLPSLLITLGAIYGIVRFFKKYLLNTKQAEVHS